jgi:hypothetical protein
MFAMISVCAGYGTDGSTTPIIVAARSLSLIVFPMTDGSLASDVVQNRCVSTATPAACGPSSVASINRPRTGRRPITSKYEALTTPARTTRGSPRPTIVKSMVENSPIADSVFTRPRRSRISGTENFAFSALIPSAL